MTDKRSVTGGIFLTVAAVVMASCYTVEVDTMEEWCVQITGGDLYESAPFWAAIPAVRFWGDSIRADYGAVLNALLMEAVDDRADRMVWIEETVLHIENLANLMVTDHDSVIAEWQRGIDRAKTYEEMDDADRCLFGGIASMFDSLVIHSAEHDGIQFGPEWTTVIRTERQARLEGPL